MMHLELASGHSIAPASEQDLRTCLAGAEYAILSIDPNTYMQCALHADAPEAYLLEYQDGSLREHYRAVDGPITLPRVIEALVKYLHGDVSWHLDFVWEKMDLA